jgi:hypothetical protein
MSWPIYILLTCFEGGCIYWKMLTPGGVYTMTKGEVVLQGLHWFMG